ncbi:MAG TPA: hypothetical protein VMJ93_07975 [Verrucomicrobiae bacterium]|nr:hypothetical protein [Verrucomicrobiae bacterium]
MLKIDRSANGRIVFTLSGRIEGGEIEQLRQLLGSEPPGEHLVLNMRDLTLVNQEAVKFLAGCESDGVTLENCPAYIREWIDRARSDGNRSRKR